MKRERERTAEREDLRQRRTKKFLVHALLALMEERPFQELSVVDICERAMVHRTTFYAHFEDKYALLRYAIGELQQLSLIHISSMEIIMGRDMVRRRRLTGMTPILFSWGCCVTRRAPVPWPKSK